MKESACFICGETYYNDNETYINVTRIERGETEVKTVKWSGMICDSCLEKHLGKAVK